jgi:hypothetical protein
LRERVPVIIKEVIQMEEKKTLTAEEKIARIEMAPKEVQVMVAKAYLLDDMDDEGVQYLFNTDSLDDMNEDVEVENVYTEN